MELLPPPVLPLEEQVRALHTRAGVRRLDDLAVLAVRGRDRESWLNGIVTQNVKGLRPGDGTQSVVVGVKGRIIAEAFIHARADELLVVTHRARMDDLASHFEKYIVMEDVTLEPVDAVVCSVQGPDGVELARELGESFRADRLGRGGADLVCTPGDEKYLLPHVEELVLRSVLAVVGPEAWEVARLEAAVPAFGVDFDTANFVQEAGLEKRAVSFNKGCYVGQEMVCRLEMRGHVQRLLVGLVVDGDPPAPGTTVVAGGAEVGAVTSAARSTSLAGRSVALAMVKFAAGEAGGAVAVGGVPATISRRPVP